MSLMRILRDGPVVSLNGSPTVSPTTEAAWASLPLPPCTPSSMYFFALSQAPPAFDIIMAKSTPVTVAPASIPEGVFAQYPPDEAGKTTARVRNDHRAGRAVLMETQFAIGLCLALHQSRNLANWRRTSSIMRKAARSTACIVSAEQERQHSADGRSDDDDRLQQVDAGYARGPRMG